MKRNGMHSALFIIPSPRPYLCVYTGEKNPTKHHIIAPKETFHLDMLVQIQKNGLT